MQVYSKVSALLHIKGFGYCPLQATTADVEVQVAPACAFIKSPPDSSRMTNPPCAG